MYEIVVLLVLTGPAGYEYRDEKVVLAGFSSMLGCASFLTDGFRIGGRAAYAFCRKSKK